MRRNDNFVRVKILKRKTVKLLANHSFITNRPVSRSNFPGDFRKDVKRTNFYISTFYRLLLLTIIVLGFFKTTEGQCPNVGQSHTIGVTSGCAPFNFSFDAVFPDLTTAHNTFKPGVKYEVWIDWGDEAQTIYPTTLSTNGSGVPILTAKPTHVYPQFTDPTKGECVYDVKMRLLVNNVECQDIKNDFTVRVWDTDGYRGGQLGINPSPVYICDGKPINVIFQDISTWNCTGNVGSPNTGARTIRWDYGENISGSSISGITIAREDASGNVIGMVNMDSQDTVRGGAFKYDDGQFIPDTRGNSWTISVPATTAADVGKTFWVRLNNWNFCNPFGIKAPETTTTRIEVIAVPDPQFKNPIGPFCKGDAIIDLDNFLTSNFFPNQLAFREFTGSGVTNDLATQKWYFDPAAAGVGTHVITYTETNRGGCSETVQTTITVDDGAVARMKINGKEVTNSTSVNICADAAVYFESISTGVNGVSWEITDGSSVIPYNTTTFTHNFVNNTGSVKLIATSSNASCPDEIVLPLNINPAVKADFDMIGNPGCSPLKIEFTNKSSSTTGQTLRYRWFFGDGTKDSVTTKDASHVYLNSTVGDITYKPRLTVWYNLNGKIACSDTTAQDYRHITIFAAPTAGQDLVVCDGVLTTAFAATTSGGIGTWSQIDGPANASISSLNDPKAILTAPITGSYLFKWEVIGGCNGIDTVAVNFVQQPKPNAGVDNSANCDLNYVLRAAPLSGIERGLWSLVSGPGTAVFQNSASNNSRVTVSLEGAYTFRWTIDPGFGCDTQYDEVVISFANPPVMPAFTVSDNSICSGTTVTFTNTSPAGASNFEWDFGDGTILTTEDKVVTHTFVNSSSFPVDFSVILTSGTNVACSRIASQIVTVEPDLQPGYPVILKGCDPFTPKFENGFAYVQNIRWLDEGGNVLATGLNPVMPPFAAQNGVETTYKVFLEGTSNGCTSTIENQVIVQVPPTADFDASAFSGCAPLNVAFTQNASADATSFVWDFGDGSQASISPNPLHPFVSPTGAQTTFDVTMTVRNANGCAASVTKQITVLPTPQADFSVTPQIQTFPDRTVTVTNLTPPGPWNYSWSFGDNSPVQPGAQPAAYNYAAPGNYTITLTAESGGCQTTRSNSIAIYPGAALAAFDAPIEGCAPFEVQFQNQSVNGFRYLWDFGNGSHSTDENPVNLYSTGGTYVVRLETYNHQGQMWSAEKTITVWPKPNAYFRPLPDRVRIPGQKVTFANFSTNADNLQWDFGDGSTSPEYEPVHQYTQTGFYDIQLAIESANGCQDTMTLVKGVEAYSEGELNVPNAFMPDKSGPSGGIYVPGDPHNHIFYPTVAAGDLEIYELQIFNRWGNLLFESREPERGWDGYYNDKLCPQDVYVWRIKCRFVNGIEIVKTGDVTLLR